MVLGVALFTMVPSYTLGRAKAVARPVVAGGALAVAFARFASSFYWGWGKEKLPAELTLVSLQF